MLYQGEPRRDLGLLLAQVALRNHAAFAQLYDATVRCLLAMVTRLLRDPAWAEEVTQEVYVAIWNSAPSYSSLKARPMTWLIAIARNKAMDALRSSAGDREHIVRHRETMDPDDDTAPPDMPCERSNVLERLVQSIEAERLRSCLQRLEPAQRQAIALAFYDGLTHSELAAHLRQPLGTVKAWVRRGLERLRPCLQG
jgi:RNA polymerase sigma-70 factor (ECF subfamily)